MDLFGIPDFPFFPSIVTRAEIPEDLASVETIDAAAETSPADVGLAPDAVSNIWDAALRWYRTGIHPAISICMRVRGQVVLRRSVGYALGGGPGEHGMPRIKVT